MCVAPKEFVPNSYSPLYFYNSISHLHDLHFSGRRGRSAACSSWWHPTKVESTWKDSGSMFAPSFKKFAKVNAECWDLKHIKGHIKRHIVRENLQPIEGQSLYIFATGPRRSTWIRKGWATRQGESAKKTICSIFKTDSIPCTCLNCLWFVVLVCQCNGMSKFINLHTV